MLLDGGEGEDAGCAGVGEDDGLLRLGGGAGEVVIDEEGAHRSKSVV